MHRLYHERLEKKAFKMSIVMMLRDVEPKERSRMVDELVEKEFDIPFSDKKTVGRTTIYSWLKEYRESEDVSEVLLHKERSDRKTFRSLTLEQKNILMRWRYDNVYRSVAQIREELLALEEQQQKDVPSEPTIARFLRSIGMDRGTLLKNGKSHAKVRLSYEAPYPQRLWMADTKGPNLYVKDPHDSSKVCIAKPIVFIDDNSRYIPSARYVYENQENEDTIIKMLMEAVALYGCPDILYLDRGGPYMGHRLKRSAVLLGCRVLHTAVRDAPAKGKIEKIMRFFYEKLESELMVLTSPVTIVEANEYMTALIRQDYHRTEHSSTDQTPEERFFAYPAQYRRFVSRKALSQIFLPCVKSHVSKTGLIHLNKLEYLVPDASLFGKDVEVRFDEAESSMVYVWYEDGFIGEAHVYLMENDYLKREELTQQVTKQKEITLPEFTDVPLYSYLERKLSAHRMEVESMSINDELVQLKTKRAKVKADLIKLPQKFSGQIQKEEKTDIFTVDQCIHLLSVLLKRKFSSYERFAIHTTWQRYGPFDEVLVRKTTGSLLGEEHPVSDLTGYLDAFRLASLTWMDRKKD